MIAVSRPSKRRATCLDCHSQLTYETSDLRVVEETVDWFWVRDVFCLTCPVCGLRMKIV